MKYEIRVFVKELYKRIVSDEAFALGAQLTYYLILSVFPFLIFLITVVSYTPITSQQALNEISLYLPPYANEIVIGAVNEVLSFRGIKFMSFSMLAALYVASSGIESLIRGLNKSFNQVETRSFIYLRFIAIIYTIILVFIFIFSFVLLVFGEVLGKYLFNFIGLSNQFISLWYKVRYILPFFTMMLCFLALYCYAPSKKIRFKNAFPGAIFSTIGWTIISGFFSFYINNFFNYSKMYGSIGGIIVLLVWLYWSSSVVIIGQEINAVLYFIKSEKIN